MKKLLVIVLPVLLLLGFIFVVFSIKLSCSDASIAMAQQDIKTIQYILGQYKNKYNRYPSTEEGLEALVSKGFLPKIPIDSWRGKYRYKLITIENYQLYSSGKNGIDELGNGDDIQEDKD